MAQQTNEPLASSASVEILLSVPPSLTLTLAISTPPLAQETSQPLYLEQGQTQVGLELVTESTVVTATQAPGASPFVPFQALPILGTQSSVAISAVGSHPFGSFAFVPPSATIPLHPGHSVDESPASQAQYLMALA